MITIKRSKSKNKTRLFIIVFLVLLLFLSYKLLAKRNNILSLEVSKVSYVEFIDFNSNTITKISDKTKVREILIGLNSLKGEKVKFDSEESEELDVINIYDNSFSRTELAKTGYFIKINKQWYKLDRNSSNKFDNIFKDYNRLNYK
ncbi:MAG: hypothetical protein ACTHWZ_03625 [Peptoniphilaceae bacterium]